jgi:hypothetical protein
LEIAADGEATVSNRQAGGEPDPAPQDIPTQAPWASWWLWLWGVVAVTLIVLVFVLPFKWWALAALVSFGKMEALGLLRPNDPYPPLTQVIRKYVPRWVAYTLIYGCTGGAGATWFKFPHPVQLALLVGLLGWFTAHFDVAFDDAAAGEERAKYQRVAALLPRKRGTP